MQSTQIKLYEIFRTEFKMSEEKAKELVETIEEIRTGDVLTQKDKTDILSRLDSHFKWLVGIMVALTSLAITISKLS